MGDRWASGFVLVIVLALCSDSALALQVGDRPSAIVQASNFPAKALAERQEGDVAVSLAIDGEARVAACKIDRPSGHPTLDAETCRLALGARLGGVETGPGTKRLTFVWRILEQPSVMDFGRATPIAPTFWVNQRDFLKMPALRNGGKGMVKLRFDISATGRMENCAADSTGSPALEQQSCAVIQSRARFVTALDDERKPMATKGEFVIKWTR